METIDLLRARKSSPWSRVKLLDDDKMSYSVEGSPVLDVGRMTLEYCLTSPVIDREGDLILPDAPDWSDHEKNPLTLFNHKLDQPFGRSQDTTGRYTVERRGDRWYGKSYLFQDDPFAEEVYRLAEKGALNGASIGFLPAKPPFGESSVKHMNGYDYTVIQRCKVFEWSAVYIPMNQDALLIAAEVVRKGLGNKPLSDRAKAMFSEYVPAPLVWANGWKPDEGKTVVNKMYDNKPQSDESVSEVPVDPVSKNVEGDAPSTPLGAQLIAGAHELAMSLAKFYSDNVGQLEPELVGEFSKLEKLIMSAIAGMAQMFNGRYTDLPPLDGADWIDPDGDGDIDVTDDPELNPDAEEDAKNAEGIAEDVKDGEDVTEDGPDAADDDVDATKDDEAVGKSEDDEEEDKPKFDKGFVESTKSKLKVLLDNWNAKQKALKEEAKKLEHPDAIVAVKSASQFLRTIAGDPREDRAMRNRAKKLRTDLLNVIPKAKAKATVVVPVAPEVIDIDVERIAKHYNQAQVELEVDAAKIQEKLNKLFQLTGMNG